MPVLGLFKLHAVEQCGCIAGHSFPPPPPLEHEEDRNDQQHHRYLPYEVGAVRLPGTDDLVPNNRYSCHQTGWVVVSEEPITAPEHTTPR
ncbi:hypothetical protein CDAR_72531 [Caerostris darwini]|uniref:Uncharacterized protein n=1 Tax=Caerostris darwini TaxID=1538125 RepID=A0AAV4MK44_9ARAC|nr:hypothetical protein CDAR_72531 [Caerostris darwini]